MRHKIGEFSKMAKVTAKTLRYYDDLGILRPVHVDRWNGYRFYSSEQLHDLHEIRMYCDIGFSLEDIKTIRTGGDIDKVLYDKRSEFEEKISLIDELIRKGNIMSKYNIEIKTLPKCIVAFRHGRIDRYEDMTDFVMGFADMCRKTNPDVECTDDDYCFVTYSDPEYKDSDIELTYAQAVKSEGVPSGEIGFERLDQIEAVCVKHPGSYKDLGDAYAFITEWMSEEGYEIADSPRECYIHGCWDRESEDQYLTEIQMPVVRRV